MALNLRLNPVARGQECEITQPREMIRIFEIPVNAILLLQRSCKERYHEMQIKSVKSCDAVDELIFPKPYQGLISGEESVVKCVESHY